MAAASFGLVCGVVEQIASQKLGDGDSAAVAMKAADSMHLILISLVFL